MLLWVVLALGCSLSVLIWVVLSVRLFLPSRLSDLDRQADGHSWYGLWTVQSSTQRDDRVNKPQSRAVNDAIATQAGAFAGAEISMRTCGRRLILPVTARGQISVKITPFTP